MLPCSTQTVCSRTTRRSKNHFLRAFLDLLLQVSPAASAQTVQVFPSQLCRFTRVLFVCFTPPWGGAERSADDLCSGLHRDQVHVDWVKAYISIWTDLQSYIKQHHTTGLSWSKSVSPP